jgi:hypothetical protein
MIDFLQSPFGRIVRVVAGLLIVGYSVYQPLVLSTVLLIVGTFIAVMGMAAVCPMAWFTGGTGPHAGRSRHSRAA